MKLLEVRYSLREQYTQTPLHLPSDRVHQIEADINQFRDLLATLYGVGDDDAVQEVYMEVHSTDGEICPPLQVWVSLRGILAYLSTISLCICASMAYPLPKVNMPVFMKANANFASSAIKLVFAAPIPTLAPPFRPSV